MQSYFWHQYIKNRMNTFYLYDIGMRRWCIIQKELPRLTFTVNGQRYKHCLNNIKLAVKNRGKWTKLLKQRMKLCYRAIGKHGMKNEFKPPKEFLKLTYSANPKIPYIVNCLEVQKSRNGIGFNITTTQDLKIGDILAIEEPFCTSALSTRDVVTQLNTEKRVVYKRCHHCHKDNFLDLIKCNECERGKSILIHNCLSFNQLFTFSHVLFNKMQSKCIQNVSQVRVFH